MVEGVGRDRPCQADEAGQSLIFPLLQSAADRAVQSRISIWTVIPPNRRSSTCRLRTAGCRLETTGTRIAPAGDRVAVALGARCDPEAGQDENYPHIVSLSDMDRAQVPRAMTAADA
jgi:hypothetical protein